MMAALDEAFLRAWSTFKIPDFNSYQKLAIEKFVIQKQDVLVNLPTGSGKSLIYQALPIAFHSPYHAATRKSHITFARKLHHPQFTDLVGCLKHNGKGIWFECEQPFSKDGCEGDYQQKCTSP